MFSLFWGVTPSQAEHPPTILISFDGYRWDYAARGFSPTLLKIAEQGASALSLEPAFPSKTFPNHYTIVTGLYPENHGIIYNNFENPFTGKYFRIGDTSSVRNGRWYWGEAIWQTAERQGLKTASYFWPGSELTLKYRRPTYFEFYDESISYEARIRQAVNWLSLPEDERPRLITLYFDEPDKEGHHFGPDSPETDAALKRLDETLASLLDSLERHHLSEKTNIIVVSDHGMTKINSRDVIKVDEILSDIPFHFEASGPMMMIEPAEDRLQEAFRRLSQNANHFRVYFRETIPEYYHFSENPFIYSLVLIADPGWTLTDTKGAADIKQSKPGGNHGYDNHNLDMHGIFYARGPSFKHGYRTGTLRNIDIYPLLCKILNIVPRQNIDGKLERIEFILRDEIDQGNLPEQE